MVVINANGYTTPDTLYTWITTHTNTDKVSTENKPNVIGQILE